MPERFTTPPPPDLLARGRPGDPRLGEWAKIVDSPEAIAVSGLTPVVLVGAPDDTGVALNRGRAGAKDGPNSIRKHFYRMTPPMDLEWEKKIVLFDIGNIIVTRDIRETHERSRRLIASLAQRGAVIIALGGGNDFAAPHFLGLTDGFSKGSCGLINVDPHFDVRPLENDFPHSGTPFRQILESGRISGKNMTSFGIRANRNSREHFKYAKSKGVNVMTLDQICGKPMPIHKQYEAALKKLGASSKALDATFDMDACREAEGTSAAPVLGFSAWEMVSLAHTAGRNPKVKLFEIMEVAPSLDRNERSSRIAAEMLFAFLVGKSSKA